MRGRLSPSCSSSASAAAGARMGGWLGGLLCCAAWLLYWPQAARADARLDIMVEDAAAPWSRPDGRGYSNDIVRAAFRAALVDVRLIVVPYARCKRMVSTGRVAACFNMSWDSRLSGQVVFA